MQTIIQLQSRMGALDWRPRRSRRPDTGASLVEYALLIALIAVVCIVAVAYFGGETSETFNRVGDSVGAT